MKDFLFPGCATNLFITLTKSVYGQRHMKEIEPWKKKN